MASGRCGAIDDLPAGLRALIEGSRRAVLATVDGAGRPHAVPITLALVDGDVVTAIDQKPKSGARPARLRNVERTGVASVLFDRYDDDWTRLAWVMVRGRARVEAPGTGAEALAVRYQQYRSDPPRGEVIVIEPAEILWWSYS